MKKYIFIIPVIMIVGLTVCLKPARDNEYDPNNPNKAKMSGYVYGLNEQPLPNATVYLMQDTEVTDTTTSGADGYYLIEGIDPGIYKLVAEALHYVSFECEPESLPANADDTIDIWFGSQYYDFETEPPNTVQPFGFDTICGTWRVVNDSTQPGEHSAPMVYHGMKTAAPGFAVAILKNSAPDFFLETRFKVINISQPGWATGALFRYQNDSNFYFVSVMKDTLVLQMRVSGIDTPIDLPHAYNFQIDTWYDLTVEMRGSRIQVYINCALIFDIQNVVLTGGKAGLWVSNINATHQASVNFDDVVMGR